MAKAIAMKDGLDEALALFNKKLILHLRIGKLILYQL